MQTSDAIAGASANRRPPPRRSPAAAALLPRNMVFETLKAILMSRSLSRHGGQFVDKRLRSEKLDCRVEFEKMSSTGCSAWRRRPSSGAWLALCMILVG